MRHVVLVLTLASCAAPASAKPVVVEASTPPDPSAPTPRPSAPTAIVSVAPIEDPACEEMVFPSAGASVLIIPGATMTRALKPVLHAACSCTRSGDRLRLTATIIPEAGTVTAVAHDDAPADACIQQTLEGHFVPFALGSDCIDCGPKRYPILDRAPRPPQRPEPSKISYPFTLVHR